LRLATATPAEEVSYTPDQSHVERTL
jgi:hypothetical protein